ncbi:MAG: anti-sigma factor antagonist [Planctomyces sp.]|nr:anti-sigma factor antagonist [Planctomyces sp.]MBA4039128.1 anti-sigma factor antagonist [Planctomyces sp.]MBA4119909.1 anti-sigma factor antagonist [Isosphaera sp.]
MIPSSSHGTPGGQGAPARGLRIASEARDAFIVLSPEGDIDLMGSPALRTEITKAQQTGKDLVIDLSKVPYMDSSGLATLVGAMQAARRTRKQITLCGLTDRVRSIFSIARLENVFRIVPTLDDATKPA